MSIPSNPGNIFLTTLNHTGDIYSPPSHSETNVPPTMDRLQFDNTLLVRKEKESDSSRLIHTLREDLSAMKEKMKFVIEKDEEIYRLQCELSLLREAYETLQKTHVTDESLLQENVEWQEECETLQNKYKHLQTSLKQSEITSTRLKKTILHLNKELQKAKQSEDECVVFNTDVIKQALNPLHYASLNRELDRLCSDYNLQDYHQINSSELHMILSDMISHCKYL